MGTGLNALKQKRISLPSNICLWPDPTGRRDLSGALGSKQPLKSIPKDAIPFFALK